MNSKGYSICIYIIYIYIYIYIVYSIYIIHIDNNMYDKLFIFS